MKPLIVLISIFLISTFIVEFVYQNYDLFLSARIGMSAMLFFTAVGHFKFTKGMAMMIPPIVPFKTEIIYLTGILEILLAICLLIPSWSWFSAWFLICFFILLLPANIYASVIHVDYQKATYDGKGLIYLWFRVPLQLFFIVWIYISAIKN